MRSGVRLVLVALGVLLAPGRVGPATLEVTKTADTADGACDGDCSLREAVIEANTNGEGDRIVLGAGDYQLTLTGGGEDEARTGDLDLLPDGAASPQLVIRGAGQEGTAVRGDEDRVFEVHPGAEVEISDVEIRKGNSHQEPGGGLLNSGTLVLTNTTVASNRTSTYGSGIYNIGRLTVVNSRVTRNNAGWWSGAIDNTYPGIAEIRGSTITDNVESGIVNNGSLLLSGTIVEENEDGIENYPPANTTITNSTIRNNSWGGVIEELGLLSSLTIESSTIHDNGYHEYDVGSPGGITIYVRGPGEVSLNNSTISGNYGSHGGGVSVYGSGGTGAHVSITNSTIAFNRQYSSFTPSPSGGIYNEPGAQSTIELRSSILAHNTYYYGWTKSECQGEVVSLGHNLSDDSSCGLAGPGDLEDTDPLLGPLADNGGPTRTHALLPGSPAIDAGPEPNQPGCPSTDQRGLPRPGASADPDAPRRCDIGAFEVNDADGDGIEDGVDRCPAWAQGDPAQADTDGDGIPDECQCGDASGDGALDGTDVLRLQNCFLGLGAACDPAVADTNGDGVIDATDVLRVQRVFLRIPHPVLGPVDACFLTCARGGLPEARPRCVSP